MDVLSGRIRNEVRYPMRKVVFAVEEIRSVLGAIKGGKQNGPDKVKGELYKSMMGSDELVRRLMQAYNGVMDSGVVLEGWINSRTVMIPKKKKPLANEHRPIALTNVGYKLFMGAVKNRIVQHLDRNGLISDYQAEFTRGRRLEENLFVVKYCIFRGHIGGQGSW